MEPRNTSKHSPQGNEMQDNSIPDRAAALLICSRLIEQEWFRGLARLASVVDDWNSVPCDISTVSITVDEQVDDRGDEIQRHQVSAYASMPMNGRMEISVERKQIEV